MWVYFCLTQENHPEGALTAVQDISIAKANNKTETGKGVSFYRNQDQGSEDIGVKISRGKSDSRKFGFSFKR